METATLSSKFQIMIPKHVRERLRLRPGQKFTVVEKGDSVVLVPLGGIEDLRGALVNADVTGLRDRSDLD
jgi:AbrB family looped-hinge helix DNA binding protein